MSPSELESSKKQAEADKKAIDDLVRERDILNKVLYPFLSYPKCQIVILNHCLIFNWYLLYLIIANHFLLLFLESVESSRCNPEATWSCAVTRANQEELGTRDSGGSTVRNSLFKYFLVFLGGRWFFFCFCFLCVCVKHSPVVVKILMLALWTNNLHVHDIMNFFPLIFVPEN